MMKKLYFIGLILTLGNLGFSQDQVVAIHPVIGDSIDIKEKRDYLLFPAVANDHFILAQIHCRNESYFLHAYFTSDTVVTPVDTADLTQYYSNIEKLHAYYSNLQKIGPANMGDTIALEKGLDKLNSNDLLTPEQRKKIGHDGRKHQMLNKSADDRGLKGQDKADYLQTGGYGEVRLKKKK
jgi:hypothetical protein